MDYTTLAIVKDTGLIKESGADTKLARFITSVSRTIDRYVTGAKNRSADDYFALQEDRVEQHRTYLDSYGNIIVFARKPNVATVSEFKWRLTPDSAWTVLDVSKVAITLESFEVNAYVGYSYKPAKVLVSMTYTGGYCYMYEDETTPPPEPPEPPVLTDVPEDIMEAATVWTLRFYREGESGLTDSIGVAELGQLIFTKQMPARVKQLLEPWVRPVGWSVSI